MKSLSKKKWMLPAIIAPVIILILIAVTLFPGKKSAENPAGTVGNIAGNLLNGGLFCEKNGVVYFSNPYDGGSLYSMDSGEQQLKKLGDISVQNILVGTDTLYYFQTGTTHVAGALSGVTGSATSMNKCTLKGKKNEIVMHDIILGAQLVDNYLYLMGTDNEKNYFVKMNADGSDAMELTDRYIHPACADNGRLYYTDPSTHALCELDTITDVTSEILTGNIWFPVIDGDYIYYVDADKNYSLHRYSLYDQTVQQLTSDRVDFYNVGSGLIYYQTAGKSPQLKYMYSDGSQSGILAEGAFHHINMTSSHVYFQAYGDTRTLYHATLGSSGYAEFTTAKESVKK